MSRKKNRIVVAALGVIALGMAWSEVAAGGVGPPPTQITFTVDENCHGSVTGTSGTTTLSGSLLCGLQNDPLPFGLPNALTYTLGADVLPGTLILEEPGVGGVPIVSDVIRFFGAAGLGPLQAVGSTLIFYSDNLDGSDAMADIGFPSQNFGTTITRTEVGPEGSNGFTYTPTAGQPGFALGPFISLTYVIRSDTVPEPATLALLGIGLAGLGLWRWGRKQ